jgi:hypothetical protein
MKTVTIKFRDGRVKSREITDIEYSRLMARIESIRSIKEKRHNDLKEKLAGEKQSHSTMEVQNFPKI